MFPKEKEMSSIYLQQAKDLDSKFRIISSSSAINIVLYGGASLVPIAVPRFCLTVLLLY